MATKTNSLYYGDNIDVLPKHIADASVDLVYLDPPFNSNRIYSVIFNRNDQQNGNTAQIQAFEDTWHWTAQTEADYGAFMAVAPSRVIDAMTAFRTLLGENDAMAYLANMAPRLVDLHRVLKKTGTLLLHCDPTMSHYLKVLLDAIFGPNHFENEIIWAYKFGGRPKKHFGRKHDVILRYTKSDKFVFNSDDPAVRVPHEAPSLAANFRHTDESGRKYREGTWPGGKKYRYYADEGRLRDDVITDINSLHQADAERLGYPTQKPLALLELLIAATTNPGDTVLDPFCGCGTTVDAAQRLGRRWVGIDVTYIAVDLILKRLVHTYGDDVLKSIDVTGIPSDAASAAALFDRSPLDFERWAVSMVNAEPNKIQVGDHGIDGIARFPITAANYGRVLMSVKGGRQLNPAMVRDLRGTIERQGAEMGILITQHTPTRGMLTEIDTSGVYTHPATGQKYPRLQLISVGELLAGKKPQMPATILPYIAAQKDAGPNTSATLDIEV